MNKKVLLIEDDSILSEMYQSKLEREGFDVATANDGEKGITIALQDHPEIILLDLLMPKMDGMTLMKKLREDPWGQKVPIIILTNLNINEKINTGIREDHPTYFFMKTEITPSDVVDRVKEVLKKSLV
ncbi:MAG TPA: response regulator [Candidatus Saccharimonadales bacterium]|nr:response regulator [Candidatus Saccharimonadales bacterium]